MTRGQDREAVVRARALAVFNTLFPGIIDNPFIPHWPTPHQARFLGAHLTKPHRGKKVFEGLYGGQAGGGKSDALLMAAAQYIPRHPEFAGVMFRRTYPDLARADGLIPRAMEWWRPRGVAWNGTEKRFTFPNGATIEMAHMSLPDAHLAHQGAAYQGTFWDELTQHPDDRQYKYVARSRCRRPAGSRLPLRALSASNPGGPGHRWVKERFVGELDLLTGELVTAPPHPYYPATIQDNPHLDQEAYIESLMDLHPTVRAQLLAGDWSARDPGDYFRLEWFGPLLDPATDLWPDRDKVSVRWWDLAASEAEDACRTAGVLMSRHRSGVRAIEHARAFKATPGKRDDLIFAQAELDGYGVVIGLEVEPGSGGLAQVESLERRLRRAGYRTTSARPGVPRNDAERDKLKKQPGNTAGKEGRADPVASCLERGYQRRGESKKPEVGGIWWGLDEHLPVTHQRDGIRLFHGPWTRDYLDEVEGFPEAELLDYVDATSGAFAWLEVHGVPQPAPVLDDRQRRAQQQDLHPDEREPLEAVKANGHWTP